MIAWDRIDDLRDSVGQDNFDEIVALFIEEVDEVVARLRDRPDPTRYAHDLHFLKGSALNLGFDALADLCQSGEQQTRAGARVDIASLIGCYEASRDVLVTSLADDGALRR